MKIIKGAIKSEMHWTARQLVENMNDGLVDFNIDIQRGYVWKSNEKKSAFIRSLILDRAVPPLFFNKVGDTYDGLDGKQRAITIQKFLNNEFALSDLEEFTVENDNGEVEEIDLNGLKFDDLDDVFKNAIKDFNFTICFTDNADPSEVADTFYNLNNGQSLNAATMNRVKAKSKDQIIRLGKDKLFKDALSQKALDGYVNEDLVARAHAILSDDNVSTDMKWIRPYMKKADITEEDEHLLTEIFDRIYRIHSLIEDNKIKKRVYAKTHMISIVPIIAESIKNNLSDQQTAEWFASFFSGKKSPSISKEYNEAAGRGTGKNSAIKIRLSEIKKSYDKYFNDIRALDKAS